VLREAVLAKRPVVDVSLELDVKHLGDAEPPVPERVHLVSVT
jgi:hypothetical protein